MDTKEAVVNGVRTITLKNGRKGVLSTDIFLNNIAKAVSEYKPAETGTCILFAGSSIVATSIADYSGTDVSDHTDDKFLQSIYSEVKNKNGNVETIKGNNGKDYLVSVDEVQGTGWMLVSYVMKNDILSELSTLSIITIVMVIVMLAISTVIIMILIKKMVTNPVTDLTNTITCIADGDFTVNIDKGGNNEIGVMNNRMYDYVSRMRKTLGDMKLLTKKRQNQVVRRQAI